jgi:hypothetical protein
MTPTDWTPPRENEDHERHLPITDAQLDHIVERAVDKVFERIYAEVGRSVLKKLAWAAGLIVTALAIWIVGRGEFK